jgi:type II secretory pathway predicted ATPase ExeA
MTRQLLAPYGLKFNPFAPEVPVEALLATPRIESFGQRVKHLVREGGFAAVLGPCGTGKSVALRLLQQRLGGVPEVVVGALTRPQCSVPDLYRELGHLFSAPLTPHNRWACSKVLRERWVAHVESTLFRPVLLVDEAQELKPAAVSELRLLMSKDLDSCALLTVVLAGDERLKERLSEPDMLPVRSRLRVRLHLDESSREEMLSCLKHVLAAAGNARLMTDELTAALVDHAGGNLRSLMQTADDLLQAGLVRDGAPLDEKLFFEVFAVPQPAPKRAAGGRR